MPFIGGVYVKPASNALVDPNAQYAAAQGQANDLSGMYMTKLQEALNNPGISDATTEAIINKGTDEVNAGQQAAEGQMEDRAAAAGIGPNSGAISQGLRTIGTDYAGQRANIARDARIAQAQQNASYKMQGLSALGDAVRGMQANAASMKPDPYNGFKPGGMGMSHSGGAGYDPKTANQGGALPAVPTGLAPLGGQSQDLASAIRNARTGAAGADQSAMDTTTGARRGLNNLRKFGAGASSAETAWA